MSRRNDLEFFQVPQCSTLPVGDGGDAAFIETCAGHKKTHSAFDELLKLVKQCSSALAAIQSKSGGAIKSESTKAGYIMLAKSLFERARLCKGGLVEAVQSTARMSTYYRRMAALRYYCFMQAGKLVSELPPLADKAAWSKLASELALTKNAIAWSELALRFSDLLECVQALAALQQHGMVNTRVKRRSKRLALQHLPPDWRTRLCQRGARGKYALALLVCALTGARPQELVGGVDVWMAYDESLGQTLICFKIRGVKINTYQGQPSRFIAYSFGDSNPLVATMVRYLSSLPEPRVFVQIANGGNFTVEVRRLAHSLWPAHKQAITAYCFRHQWSADTKAAGDADAVSRGLGHSSAKTRRYYGTARQSKGSDRLHPVRIEAERPIRKCYSHPVEAGLEAISQLTALPEPSSRPIGVVTEEATPKKD